MMPGKSRGALLESLDDTSRELVQQFDEISPERRETLMELSRFVRDKVRKKQVANLNFICTHNSRRSHMAQLWAQAAAWYYGVEDVACFSGGTEATAFNPRAAQAMEEAGFDIKQISQGKNPAYEVRYSKQAPPLRVFSKTYDDPSNPSADFAAIMTCSHADENCPLITGASQRISITYDDPKNFDGTPMEATKYMERALDIGREMLFAFSQV